MKANFLALLLGTALLAGCTTTETANTATTRPPPSSMSKVALLFAKPDKAYQELGSVSTLKTPLDPSVTWQDALRKQAANLGADAVVVDSTTLNNTFTTTIMGKAIRYAPASQ